MDGYRAATRQTIRRTLAPGPGTNGQPGYDALYITPDHIDERLVTHVARAPDDLREGDTTSVNPVDRGVLGEDKTFDEGHEISGRFDNAYGIYSCIAQSCTLNISDIPGAGITDMSGWVFTPTSYAGAGGGTRAPQVTVADSDYRWFGFWLPGADPSAEDGFEVRTFSGTSRVRSRALRGVPSCRMRFRLREAAIPVRSGLRGSVVAALILFLAACGGGGGPAAPSSTA